MEEEKKHLPIGVFDSGVGGISVLAEMMKLLPNERFVYYADSLHAPYGLKDKEVVRALSIDIAGFLYNVGIKALVVACNTATSVAVRLMREKFPIPVIGMEPALKPAVEIGCDGKILVMATPITLREEKFHNLLNKYGQKADVEPLPCPGLVELIEAGNTKNKAIRDYLQNILDPFLDTNIGCIVLGCTHYLFVKKEIAAITGNSVQIIDGNLGTARHLKNIIEEREIVNDSKFQGENRLKLYTSGDYEKVFPLCHRLLNSML